MIDLSAIRARAEAATKGPWDVIKDDDDPLEPSVQSHDGWWIAQANDAPGEAEAIDNATFIAHARADVPALLEECERLRGIVSACEGVGVSVVALPDGRTAVNNVRAMKAESACEWVPVGVRLPEVNADVLAVIPGAIRPAICWLMSNGDWRICGDGQKVEVMHWMPLPSPPEVK